MRRPILSCLFLTLGVGACDAGVTHTDPAQETVVAVGTEGPAQLVTLPEMAPIEEVARLDVQGHQLRFLKYPGGALGLLESGPLGEPPVMTTALNKLDYVSAWKELAKGQPVPNALTEAVIVAGQESELGPYAPEAPAATASEPPASGESGHAMATFLTQCHVNSPHLCSTNFTTGRRHTWPDVHKSQVMLDVLTGSMTLIWASGSKVANLGTFGPSHVVNNFHNNHGFLGYALEADIAWESWVATNPSSHHFGSFSCSNDCFWAATGF